MYPDYTHNVVIIDKLPEGQVWSPDECEKLRKARVVFTPLKNRPGRLVIRDKSDAPRIAKALGVGVGEFIHDETDVNKTEE